MAKYNLGYIYKTGDTVEKDINSAAYWYWKALQDGYLRAKKRLDEIYDMALDFKKQHPEYQKLNGDYETFEN